MTGGSECSGPVMHLCYTWKKRKREDETIDDFDDAGILKALAKLANAELARKQSAKVQSTGMGCLGSPLSHLKRPPKPNMVNSPRPVPDLDVGPSLNPISTIVVSDAAVASTEATNLAEFRRPEVPPARSASQQQQVGSFLLNWTLTLGVIFELTLSRPLKCFLLERENLFSDSVQYKLN